MVQGQQQFVTLQYTDSATTYMADGDNATLVGLEAYHRSVIADKGGHSHYPGLNKAIKSDCMVLQTATTSLPFRIQTTHT